MFDTTTLGKRIHEKRKVKGLTQGQLGALVGVTAQAVSRWENGDSAPDLGIIPGLCKVLEVTSDHLLAISKQHPKYSQATLEQAQEVYKRTGTLSASQLQKELLIGYREAKELIEEMSDIVGEFSDEQGRKNKVVEGISLGLTCTFCGKHQSEVERLIAGPGVGICNGCVDLCNRILRGEEFPLREP